MSMIGKAITAGSLVGGAIGLFATKKAGSMLQRGTALTNPLFPITGQKKAYGKRGIDGNRMSTEGLAQNLHKKRRKF